MKFSKIAIGDTRPLSYYEGLHDRVITMHITIPESHGPEEQCAGVSYENRKGNYVLLL